MTLLRLASWVFFTIFIHHISTAQSFEWPLIPYQELEMTHCPHDSSATAVILYQKDDIDVNSSRTNNDNSINLIHKRVKILKEAAIHDDTYTNYYLYYSDNNVLKRIGGVIRSLKARVIAPDGTFTELTDKDFFFSKEDDDVKKVTIAFPNVTKGCIIEYIADLRSSNVLMPNWQFFEETPIMRADYRFNHSRDLGFVSLLRGIDNFTREQLGPDIDIYTTNGTTLSRNGYNFSLQNAPALKDEPYITTPEDYSPLFQIQLTQVQVSDNRAHEYFGDWPNLAEYLFESYGFGKTYFQRTRYNKLAKLSETVVNADADDLTQIQQIFTFITENIQWNRNYGIFANDFSDDAMYTSTANLATVQFSGLALLRHYGIEAYPVILSTRAHGQMTRTFPLLRQFNYVIVLAMVDGKGKLIDFANPLFAPGIINPKALNHEGFLVHDEKEQSRWIDLLLPTSQAAINVEAQLSEDGTLYGEVNSTFNGYQALNYRLTLNKIGSKIDFQNAWNNEFPTTIELTDFSVVEPQNSNIDLLTSTKFTAEEAGFPNEDFLYFSPLVYSSFRENPFKKEARTYPVDFSYPFEERSIYNIQLPEGYTVETLPDRLLLDLPNRSASIQFIAAEKEGVLKLLYKVKINQLIFSPDEYPALRDLFDQLAQKMQEQIVLRKIQ
jgi:hypothetical protein